MEVRGNHDYYGDLYAGSNYIEMRMIFDTMSQYTILTQKSTVGGDVNSNYVQSESRSSIELFLDDARQDPDDINVHFNSAFFQGTKYKDNMCLYQTREERTAESGFLCVR